MATEGSPNPFEDIKKTTEIDGKTYSFFHLAELKDARYDKLPYSIRVLLESAVRNCDKFQIQKSDVENILNWEQNQGRSV
uniref:Probable cytoplasmic aconitate hydratase n=1 Tax=Crassostrea virginica TaxID=6565 RepID=A0A8B8C8K7_CRAVI|nr:probable cytoplasmic aconitate hydratase [Crassostrea virginica]